MREISGLQRTGAGGTSLASSAILGTSKEGRH
jgi:hypothetical protein